MQRTFLRSDSDDIIRLHQYFQTTFTRSLKYGFPIGFVNKLLDELERARCQCQQLIAQNQQIEATLKQTKRELITAKETIERLMEEQKGVVERVKKEAKKSRRSASLPPETPVAVGAQHPHAINHRPFVPSSATIGVSRNTRLAMLRTSRISSSHGDLSRMAVLEDEEDDLGPDSDGPCFFAEQAVHSFQTKRNFLRIQCGRCDVFIRFGVLYVKCVRCKGSFHEACRKQAPLPCVIRKQTPKPPGAGKHGRPRLGDYCPDTRPMVPPLVTFCTYHLDKSTVSYEDLYQLDGDPAEVEAITKLFHSNKAFPKLEGFDPLNITSCVKKFLGQIREPIIPYSYGKEICSLLDIGDGQKARDGLPGLVEDLPLAHMDTLGHLCRHWNRMIANSNGQLTVDLLAVSLGPVVFGSSRAESPLAHQPCIQSMAHLLLLAPDFWTSVSISPPTSRSVHSQLSGSPLSRNPSQLSAYGTTPRMPNTMMSNVRELQSQRRNDPTTSRQQPQITFDSTIASNFG